MVSTDLDRGRGERRRGVSDPARTAHEALHEGVHIVTLAFDDHGSRGFLGKLGQQDLEVGSGRREASVSSAHRRITLRTPSS